MRTIMTVMMIAMLVALTGCNEGQSMSVWALGTTNLDSQDNEFTGRGGICDGKLEAGFETTYYGPHGHQAYGGYALLHLEGNPSSWLGQPYIGYHATVADAEDGGQYGPIVGTVYGDIFVIEAQPLQGYNGKLEEKFSESHDENRVYAGVVLEF